MSRRALIASGTATLFFRHPAAAGQITDASGRSVAAKAPSRIVSIGSSVTEIIADLGEAGRIAAIDSTSAGIAEIQGKPDVGYLRALSAEGILSQSPDLICATSDAGPPEVIDALRDSGIPLALIPHIPTLEGILQKIALIGTLLDCEEAARKLAGTCRIEAEALEARVAAFKGPPPKVLFVLSFTDGRLIAGGAGTSAQSVISMAGGRNIASGMTGYKPLSPELLLAEPPDVIITMSNAGIAASQDALLAFAPLQVSPAVRNKAIRAFDGAALLGFGPRTIAAAGELAAFIHGEPAP